MPKSHFVTLIIRLALGLIILALLGTFLVSRLKKGKTPTVSQATPTPGVVVIYPTPVPTPETSVLPVAGERDTYNSTGAARTPTPNGTPQSRTYRRIVQTTTTSAVQSQSSASATASGNSVSVSAHASSGSASASASARSW